MLHLSAQPALKCHGPLDEPLRKMCGSDVPPPSFPSAAGQKVSQVTRHGARLAAVAGPGRQAGTRKAGRDAGTTASVRAKRAWCTVSRAPGTTTGQEQAKCDSR